MVRFTSTGTPQTNFVSSFYVGASQGLGGYFVGPEVIWVNSDPIPAGWAPWAGVNCFASPVPVGFSFDFSNTPSTPTTYTGTATYATRLSESTRGLSRLFFVAPGAAQYVAELQLANGSLTLASDRAGTPRVFASSGRFPLGTLPQGTHSLSLAANEGPQARWTVRIRALPVEISSTSVAPAIARPGRILTVRYTMSADATLDAHVVGPGGRQVRTSATKFPVQIGQRTLRWDGLDGGGRPVTNGVYQVKLNATDPSGSSAQAAAAVVIDRTAPVIRAVTRGRLGRSQGIVIEVKDPTAGVRSGLIALEGRPLMRIVPGKGRYVVIRPGGWLGSSGRSL